MTLSFLEIIIASPLRNLRPPCLSLRSLTVSRRICQVAALIISHRRGRQCTAAAESARNNRQRWVFIYGICVSMEPLICYSSHCIAGVFLARQKKSFILYMTRSLLSAFLYCRRIQRYPSKPIISSLLSSFCFTLACSMSVDETNRVRAMLGLKPLNTGGGASGKPTNEEVRMSKINPLVSLECLYSVLRPG